MKKLLFALLLCLITSYAVQAQTKEETITWLTEKMMKPGFFKDDYNYKKIIADKVEFDDNFLTVYTHWVSKDEVWNGSRYILTEYKQFNKYKINLAKLSEHFFKYPEFISTEGSNIEYAHTWERYGWNSGVYGLQETKKGKEYIERLNIRIGEEVEPDIQERFSKAIKHYQTLMTLKKSAETF